MTGAGRGPLYPPVVERMTELIGGTPLVRLRHLPGPGAADVFVKCEQFNPGGSVKDRVALAMIDRAERAGQLVPGESTIVEPTSGNTGVGLALVSAVKHYRLILTMPDNMSIERLGQVLRRRSPAVRVVAVEPARAAVLSGREPCEHRIDGIGAGFIPPILDRSIISEVRTIEEVDAQRIKLDLARREGLLVGISSGAAVKIALDLARELGAGKTVVTVLPDTGERYFSLDESMAR
jgi:cysteine synthase